MTPLSTAQRSHDNAQPDERSFEPDGVGDPAQEIRDGFAAGTAVPLVHFRDKAEVGKPVAIAIMDAIDNIKGASSLLKDTLAGDEVARHRLNAAIVNYWISEHEEDIRSFRRGELFGDGA